jgi:hypothetical protein
MINRHSSHSALVLDVAVLVIFTQFITACHSLRLFPGDTSWQRKKFLVQNKMIKLRNDSVKLTVADMESAEIDLARYVQRRAYGAAFRRMSMDAESYSQVIDATKNRLMQKELHGLADLCPFFDSHGVLRVKGRLSKIDISYDRRHQIILPKRHHYTNLVVQKYHEDMGHAGPEMTLGATRKKYWIIAGINTVKYYLKSCVTCIKKHSRAIPQLMGEHPVSRAATWEPAFSHTGIDYFGPFRTTTGTRNKTTKRWGVIFTCLTSRAIHLDIVDSLSMDACINALERFLAQYADVMVAFYSDNGTNFQGTSNAMTRMYNKNMHQQLQRYFRPRRISWHFNTPSASSQGGAWD